MCRKVAKPEEGRQGALVTKCVEELFSALVKICNSRIAESNSIKLLLPKFLLAEKMTLKVEIPVFQGLVLPSDFSSQAGTLSSQTPTFPLGHGF